MPSASRSGPASKWTRLSYANFIAGHRGTFPPGLARGAVEHPHALTIPTDMGDHDLSATVAVEVGRHRPVAHRNRGHWSVIGHQIFGPNPLSGRDREGCEVRGGQGLVCKPCCGSRARISAEPSPSRSAYWMGRIGAKPSSIDGLLEAGLSPDRGRSTSSRRSRPRTSHSPGRYN